VDRGFRINPFVIKPEMKMLHASYEGDDSCYGWDFNGYNADQLEVIGNIYENPELLKELRS
jgi:hypothetical protein